MTDRTDTAMFNTPAPYFEGTGRQVVLGNPNNATESRWSFVYTPASEAVAWDLGAENVGAVTHALGSRYGGYGYVRIRVTGRVDRYPGVGGPARKIRVTVAVGTEDEETVDGWLVGGGTL